MAGERIQIISDKCVGCGLCEDRCPFNAISLGGGKAFIDYDACTLCGACVSVCSFDAIRTAVTQSRGETGRGEVWVICEPAADGGLNRVSAELLTAARDLAASLGVQVGAFLAGTGLQPAATAAIQFGADTVYLADHPRLDPFRDEPFAAVLTRAIRQYHPEIVLGGATAVGRALLPRVAVEVNTGLTADCTALSIDPETGLLLQTRPAFGGNILATIQCERHRPQMATVRPGVLPAAAPDAARTGRLVALELDSNDLQSSLEWLAFRPSPKGGSDLRDANIIVAAGAGAGGPEGVALVAELAAALGGCLGASRAAVDAGWADYPQQVGQTGVTVQPKLYIACGISGAVQHLVGMQNSDMIVAINRDPDAPIFRYADVGIHGDLREIIPDILRLLKDSGRS